MFISYEDDSYITSTPDTCLIKNSTVIISTLSVYEGIPETLVLNFVSWSVLILTFCILRNRAWNYGRLALVQGERLTQLLYGDLDGSIAQEAMDSIEERDQGCCSWIPTIFTISKEKFFTRCGPDAILYLSFQKHLMGLMAIIMVVALTVVLPLNFQGELQGNQYTFGHTTISNLDPTSSYLWVHIFLAFAFAPLTLVIMKRCANNVPTKLSSSQTIMVTNIAREHRNPEEIIKYFSLVYPSYVIKEVNLAHDVSKLMLYEKQRINALQAKLYCEMYHKDNLRAQPRGCYVCCPCSTVDALEYFTNEEKNLIDAVKFQRDNVRPLGIAFVTLETADLAKDVVEHFRPGTHYQWIVCEAPAPSDIFWENLGVKNKLWYLRAVLVNLFLFVVLFFLTTPAIIVNTLNSFYISHNHAYKLDPILSEFVPTLLLWTMSALLPVLVSYSDEWLPHWTKSKQNQAIMQKTLIFLLLMVLILPSLGLTSAQALVEWSLQTANRTYRWECVFLPDKGAFFVNYVITSALIGTSLELIRLPELSLFLWKLCTSRSKAEIIHIQKNVLYEYPYGVHYAWTLVIYTVTVTYSLICPLITPFGLMYLCLKHIVDRHNLYFAYRSSNMGIEGRQIHGTAVKTVRLGVVFLQASLAGLTVLRGGLGPLNILICIGLVITVGFFLYVSPFPNCMAERHTVTDDQELNYRYIAPVLLTPQNSVAVSVVGSPHSGTSHYGTSSDVEN